MTVLTPHRVRRLENGRLEHYFPDRHANGMYELADPARGSDKHHQKNAIFVADVGMAIHLVRQYGFAIRMRGNVTGQRNLISADEIQCL